METIIKLILLICFVQLVVCDDPKVNNATLSYEETTYTGDRKIKLSCDTTTADGKPVNYIIFGRKIGESHTTFAKLYSDGKVNETTDIAGVKKENITAVDNKTIYLSALDKLEDANFECSFFQQTTQGPWSKDISVRAKFETVKFTPTFEKDRKDNTFKKDDKVVAVCNYELRQDSTKLIKVHFKKGEKEIFSYDNSTAAGNQTDTENYDKDSIKLDTANTNKPNINGTGKVTINIEKAKDKAQGDYTCDIQFRLNGWADDKSETRTSDKVSIKYDGSGAGAVFASITTIAISMMAFLKIYY
ncbi:uncharacterized protein LOC128960545 [Oppia nitens]|uniref:uncharacterized protein LOC128960545 n=1 Tax=Oppia nitens TaxID=1686743 RepID=UPI0023DB543E|nr:uncharacterized protein LOC128960545 [Oppia nitens]